MQQSGLKGEEETIGCKVDNSQQANTLVSVNRGMQSVRDLQPETKLAYESKHLCVISRGRLMVHMQTERSQGFPDRQAQRPNQTGSEQKQHNERHQLPSNLK